MIENRLKILYNKSTQLCFSPWEVFMEFTAEEMKVLLRSVIQEELKPLNERLDAMDNRFDAMDSRLDAIDSRFDKIESQLSSIREDTEITRTAVNSLIEWADDVSVITQIKFPVAQKKA